MTRAIPNDEAPGAVSPDTADSLVLPDTADSLVLPVADMRTTARWLRADLARRRRNILLTVSVGLVAAAAAVAPIYLLGGLIDRIRTGGASTAMWPLATAILATALISGLLSGLSGYLVNRLGEQTLADLRERVMRHALHLPSNRIEEAGRGDLLSRVGADVSAISGAVSQVLPASFNAALLAVFSLGGMFGLDWRLGLAGAIAVPAYYLAIRWYLPRSAPLYGKERAAVGTRAQVMVESMQGSRTVAAYEMEHERLASIDEASRYSRDLSVSVFKIFTRFIGRINRAEFIGLAAILITGFVLVRQDMVTIGAASAAALMFHRLFGPVGIMLFTFDEAQTAAAGLRRLVGVLEVPLPSATTAADRTPESNAVDIDDVHFRYRTGGEVLHGISLQLPAGSRTAVVGSTGAGKTTIAAIVAGLLSPTAGEVRLGGVPITELNPTQLRTRIATVTQEVHVFSGTLIDDLRLGRESATREEIHAALTQVGADRWVDELPDGVDTLVGELGTELTAAQAQHLALARLVLADPDVVVLDEATAEAGSARARSLERAAIAATEGRTTLVVAHRLTQAASADQIVVLENGAVLESGKHEELIAREGRYRELWQAWAVDQPNP